MSHGRASWKRKQVFVFFLDSLAFCFAFLRDRKLLVGHGFSIQTLDVDNIWLLPRLLFSYTLHRHLRLISRIALFGVIIRCVSVARCRHRWDLLCFFNCLSSLELGIIFCFTLDAQVHWSAGSLFCIINRKVGLLILTDLLFVGVFTRFVIQMVVDLLHEGASKLSLFAFVMFTNTFALVLVHIEIFFDLLHDAWTNYCELQLPQLNV